MTFDYDVTLDDRNHIVAHLDGKKCLIDTGSPVTLCDEVVWFGDKKSSTKPKMAGIDLSGVLEATGWSMGNIKKLSGLDIDALIGMDLLGTQRWYVDPFQKTLTVGFLPKGKVSTFSGRVNGASPIVEAEVNGSPAELLIDTGANVHFISKACTSGWKSVGVHEDFYPTVGKFTSPKYEVGFRMFGHNFGEMAVAEFPEYLDAAIGMQSMLTGTRMHGIAGMEILNHGTLGFDFRTGVVVFSPKEI